jgi:flavin reductase (DIM6/NTAB) family NADH-FMN oxidoreductase RutF
MSLDPDSFRAVLGRFASGVTIVTSCDAHGDDQGMTVSAFCSLSLTPPLILVCIDHQATMHDTLREAPYFAINMLAEDQEALARRFADTDAKRFDGVGYRRGQNGLALLDDALAHLECKRTAVYDGGDHTIVVGEVEHATMRDTKPLLYYRGGFAQLER